jgi:hypothetical protein
MKRPAKVFAHQGEANHKHLTKSCSMAMGINRARKQGTALGRPRVEVDPLQVTGLRSRGLSWNQIAQKLNVGRGTAERAFRSLSQKPLGTIENPSLIQ